jgi:hypothetical protein
MYDLIFECPLELEKILYKDLIMYDV